MLGPAEVETGLPGDFPLENSKHPFLISAIQLHIVWSEGQVFLLVSESSAKIYLPDIPILWRVET